MVTHDPIIRFYDDPGHPYWPNNTASIKAEIMAIATEHGYTGAAPKTIAGAIDALADTLAGEDVSSPRSIAGAIHALAPYIGSGGGSERVELFNETVTMETDEYGNIAALAYNGEITDNPLHVVFDGVEYELPKSSMGNAVIYGTFIDGESDFSTYPLALEKDPDGWFAHTKTAGTHTIIAYTDSSGGGGAELGASVGVFVVFGGQPGTMPSASHVTVMNGDAVMMDCTTEDGYLKWYTPDEGGLIIPSGESLTTTITFSDDTAASIDSVVSAKILDNASETETDYVVTYALSSDKKTLSVTIPAIPQSGFGLVVILRGGVQ